MRGSAASCVEKGPGCICLFYSILFWNVILANNNVTSMSSLDSQELLSYSLVAVPPASRSVWFVSSSEYYFSVAGRFLSCCFGHHFLNRCLTIAPANQSYLAGYVWWLGRETGVTVRLIQPVILTITSTAIACEKNQGPECRHERWAIALHRFGYGAVSISRSRQFILSKNELLR